MDRRFLLQSGLAAASGVALPQALLASPAAPKVKSVSPLLTQFVQPVPLPGAGIVVATPSAGGHYDFTLRQITRTLHPQLPPTPIWAYDDGSGLTGQAGSFGMAVVAQSGTPLTMTFKNALPNAYPRWLPVDTRLTPMANMVHIMTHLHGGFVAEDSDGNPGVTPMGFGPGETQSVYYGNQQPASLLWFHDHAMGATRLNVFAGLAAGYILRDQYDTGAEPNPIGIPGGNYEIPLVIQDRQFNADGTFLYPVSSIGGTTWVGEYFGDAMLVNGKVWPYLNVEPRMYRLRFLNGCNARILDLDLGGIRFWQIGSEGGLFDQPVPVSSLILGPAERADVLVDFSALAGKTLMLRNSQPPKPVMTPAPSLGQVMQIRVGTTVTVPGPRTIPASLPGGRLANLPAPPPSRVRYITLNEFAPETANWLLTLNGARFDAPATEAPRVGTVEDWVYVNLTGDTHPMHLHLVTFQVVGRTPFNAEAYAAAYPPGPLGVTGGIDPSAFATGPMVPALPTERGFKDTVQVHPGTFTRIRVKFDLPPGVHPPQRYVHHCHIVEHEDNDMMRPFVVGR